MEERVQNIIPTKNVAVSELGGAQLRFLAPSEVIGDAGMSVLEGTLPPGVVVPLHSHPEAESFYMLEGTLDVYQDDGGSSGWSQAKQGDLVIIRSSVKHAWRNPSTTPSITLVFTGGQVCGFLQEIAQPWKPGQSPQLPSPEYLEHLLRASREYNYWLGTPEENAAIGLS